MNCRIRDRRTLTRRKTVSVSRFAEWTRQYGEIYSLRLGSSNVVILGSVAAVKEVVEKNSGLMSDQPRSALVDSVFGERSSGWTLYCERTFCYR